MVAVASRRLFAQQKSWIIPDSSETKQVSAELHVERIRDAGRHWLKTKMF